MRSPRLFVRSRSRRRERLVRCIFQTLPYVAVNDFIALRLRPLYCWLLRVNALTRSMPDQMRHVCEALARFPGANVVHLIGCYYPYHVMGAEQRALVSSTLSRLGLGGMVGLAFVVACAGGWLRAIAVSASLLVRALLLECSVVILLRWQRTNGL